MTRRTRRKDQRLKKNADREWTDTTEHQPPPYANHVPQGADSGIDERTNQTVDDCELKYDPKTLKYNHKPADSARN